MTDLQKFLKFINGQIDKKYQLGSTGPNQYDCSGLIYNALQQLTNAYIPRTSTDQYGLGIKIGVSDIRAGDLVFFDSGWIDRKPNHNGVCLDADLMINANAHFHCVKKESFSEGYWMDKVYGFRRIFDVQGNLKLEDKVHFIQHFTDTPPGHPCFSYIENLYTKGLVEGYGDGSFRPDVNINRVEALKILLLALTVDIDENFSELVFSDIKKGAWYEKLIAAGLESGIINGYPDGTFRPDQFINRAEMCKIIFKSGKIEPDNPHASLFQDIPINSWYAKYVLKAVEWEMFDALSFDIFGPDLFVKRGEMCKAIVQFVDNSSFL